MNNLPVFFSDKMVAHPRSFSPSAAKPARVLESWLQHALAVHVMQPEPVSPAQLSLAHDPDYVADVLACRRSNGFGDTAADVAQSLPWTSGALLSAARHVVSTHGVACAPCSGFHHAGYRRGGGFCTFNGLMVTACVLHSEGRCRRIGILDCDEHYGDGTVEIIETLQAGSWTRHFTAGKHFSAPGQGGDFFRWLRETMEHLRDCDLVLYQAGADPHVKDPLGGWLTTDELRERDAIVFDAAREAYLPLVWNLAGGYQQDPDGTIPRVLEIHENTALECIRAFKLGDPP